MVGMAVCIYKGNVIQASKIEWMLILQQNPVIEDDLNAICGPQTREERGAQTRSRVPTSLSREPKSGARTTGQRCSAGDIGEGGGLSRVDSGLDPACGRLARCNEEVVEESEATCYDWCRR